MSPARLAPALLLLLALLIGCTDSRAELPQWAEETARPATPAAPVPSASPTAAAATTPASDPDLRQSPPTPLVDGEVIPVITAAGDRAWLLTLEADGPDQLVGIRRVVDPTGETRYWADLRSEVVLVDELDTRVLADAGAIGLYVAAPPGGVLPPGEWTVEVATNGEVVTSRSVVTHGEATEPRQLDLMVWATTSADVGAVAGTWRAAMDEVLSPHGLSVGRLDVVVAGEAGAAHRALGLDVLAGDAHQACEAATAALVPPPRTAVVVLADHLGEGITTAYRAPDGEIRGFAVATPGTPVLGPASHGCVAVAPTSAPVDGVEGAGGVGGLGLVALHEVLHLAGLTAHTTEQDGRTFDRFTDTPECDVSRDADLDRKLNARECAGQGADNLMFWAEGGTQLTASQTWRIRWHPLFHPIG